MPVQADVVGPASRQILDFRKGLGNVPAGEIPIDPKTGRPFVLTPKQIKRRALRQVKKKAQEHGVMYRSQRDLDDISVLEVAYKPIEDWDEEELARGRPKAIDGTFRGRPPVWVSRAMHETAMETFKELVRGKMRVNAMDAVEFLSTVLGDDRYDDKGRPLTTQSTKVDAAKFLVEHLLGKPKQEVSADISVKLQGVLAQAMVPMTADAVPMDPVKVASEKGHPYEAKGVGPEAIQSIIDARAEGRDPWEGLQTASGSAYGDDWEEDDDAGSDD